ncbi:MAG: hypothetical protein H6581_21510 [Bacteroidia bacterium]|nr:hypothetical protein [Bacteroidia bacterium]
MEKKIPYHDDPDLKEIAPRLAALQGKPLPLAAPEGYFDSFADRLMEKVKAEEKPSGNGGAASLNRKMIPVSLAAVLILLVLFSVSAWFTTQRTPVPDFSQLTPEEILAELEVAYLDEEFLINAMGDEALASLDLESQIPPESISEYFSGEDLPEGFEFDLQPDDLDWLDSKINGNEL